MAVPQLLVGKVAAVTGGLTGIGRAIALTYLRHGAKVAVNHLGSRSPNDEAQLGTFRRDAAEVVASTSTTAATADPEEPANARSSGLRFITVAGDISQPEAGRDFVAKTVEAFGQLDIFVSNAGVCQFADFLEIEPSLLEHTVSVNLSGAFYATQAAARQMALAQNPPGGSIIGISSISALVGGGRQTHYTPTKAGVLSLMQSCAVALGKYKIRCNAILPGTIQTQLNDEDLSDETKRTYVEGRTPLGRLGKPEDIAGPAVFLACEQLSGYMTGAQLLVDGGMFVNLQ